MVALAVLQHAHLHPRKGRSHDRPLPDPVRFSVLPHQPWRGVGTPPHGKGVKTNRSAALWRKRLREREETMVGGGLG